MTEPEDITWEEAANMLDAAGDMLAALKAVLEKVQPMPTDEHPEDADIVGVISAPIWNQIVRAVEKAETGGF